MAQSIPPDWAGQCLPGVNSSWPITIDVGEWPLSLLRPVKSRTKQLLYGTWQRRARKLRQTFTKNFVYAPVMCLNTSSGSTDWRGIQLILYDKAYWLPKETPRRATGRQYAPLFQANTVGHRARGAAPPIRSTAC